MSTVKTKPSRGFFKFKLGIGVTSISMLIIILLQNLHAVDMEILIWKIHTPLFVLLLITALLSALAFFALIMILGKN